MVPRVDKYITDFLGKRMPKDRDAELMRVQAAVLAIARPLTSSWQKLQETEAEDSEEIRDGGPGHDSVYPLPGRECF